MKKTFVLLFAICAWLSAYAQSNEPELENGSYVYKFVQQAEGVSQNALYLRAHAFLSDWVGPNTNSKSSIDFDDKESATIIAKGTYFLGYEREMMYGWNVYADFSVTIKCKEGRFQVMTKMPTMSFWWTAGNVPMQTILYNELYPSYTHKGPYKLKRYSDKYVNQMPEYIKEISNIVINGIISASDDDDF